MILAQPSTGYWQRLVEYSLRLFVSVSIYIESDKATHGVQRMQVLITPRQALLLQCLDKQRLCFAVPAQLAREIDQWKTVDPPLSRIIPGLSIYQRRDGKAVPSDPDLVQIQRRLCQQRATHGNLYFSLHHLSDDLIDVFREEFYRTKAPAYVPLRRRP